jgi:hypothetical protein
MLAEWLSVQLNEEISEITDPDHRALKVRPTLHGLRPTIWPTEAATATVLEKL